MAATTITLPIHRHLLLLAAAAIFLPRARADAAFVASTCKNTHNVPVCTAMFESQHSRSILANSTVDLVVIALQVTAGTASDTGDDIKKLIAAHPGGAQEAALNECSKLHSDAAGNLNKAANDVSSEGQQSDAPQLVNSASNAAVKCGQAFSSRRLTSPVAQKDQTFKDQCGVCSDLIQFLD